MKQLPRPFRWAGLSCSGALPDGPTNCVWYIRHATEAGGSARMVEGRERALIWAAGTTRLELVRAFTRYARAHRADLDLRATALVIPALSNAFPCPLPGRTEAGPPKAG